MKRGYAAARRVLLAFDKFKGSLTAPQACQIAAEAWQNVRPQDFIDQCPLTDGGDDFARLLTRSVAGGIWRQETVTGPRGGSVMAGYGLVRLTNLPSSAASSFRGVSSPALLAVVDVASASGFTLLDPGDRDPWFTHTTGTGQLLRAAHQAGADGILLGLGGSATNDLGLGALSALGLEAVCGRDAVLPPCPAAWNTITGFRSRLPENFPRLFLACDVTNPLLGLSGCTAIYGPQKGLPASDVPVMETAVARMSSLLAALPADFSSASPNLPGTGAAGGIGFGLACAFPGKVHWLGGADLVFSWLALPSKVDLADIVLTGEGSFDASSLSGKAPARLLQVARASAKSCGILAGRIDPNSPKMEGVHFQAITPPEIPPDEVQARAPEFLARAVREWARQVW